MSKNPDLFTIKDVCEFFNLSEQTVRRRIRAARNGESSFPESIFGKGKRAVWHRREIENWKERGQEQSEQEG